MTSRALIATQVAHIIAPVGGHSRAALLGRDQEDAYKQRRARQQQPAQQEAVGRGAAQVARDVRGPFADIFDGDAGQRRCCPAAPRIADNGLNVVGLGAPREGCADVWTRQ